MNLKEALTQLTQSSEDMPTELFVSKTIDLIKATIDSTVLFNEKDRHDFEISFFTTDIGEIK